MGLRKIKIALLIDKSGSYDRGLIRGIINYSRLSTQWDFFIDAPAYTGIDENSRLIGELKTWKPDYIVMNDNYLTPEYHTLNVPILVTSSSKIIPEVINIVADDKKIGKLAAKYFIHKGYKNFAFYGNDKIFWSKKRKAAFKKKVSSSGLGFFEFEASLSSGWSSNPQRLAQWMKQLPLPIAFFGCCDEFSVHIIEAAHLAGLNVPTDIAVLGVDNDLYVCDLYNPPMSSIDQEPKEVGFSVAKAIYQSYKEGKHISDKIIGSNFHVVTRHSTDIFAVNDKHISKALNYIKDNACAKNINVDDVVGATSLSRRMLEIRFRNVLNRSISDEIRKVRVDSICKQLIQSEVPINEIAYSMGFSSVTTFANFFKRERNITPTDFRKQFRSKE